MSLVDLKSKHSLLGVGTNGQPISEMANNVGPEFANFRNIRYNSSAEPSQGDNPIWPTDWELSADAGKTCRHVYQSECL